MKIKIPVITLIQDDQAGGFSANVYNNNDELLKNHSALEDLEGDELEEKKQEILNGSNEYENGYIGSAEIVIEINEKTGKAKLVKPVWFHGGQ
jgi:hypothetical protein